jgi:hypothetical protein
MSQKIEITKKVLEILDSSISEKELKLAKREWWVSQRTKPIGGLQLTKAGFTALSKAGIKSYKIRLEERPDNLNGMLLWIDNHITYPFYFFRSHQYHYIFVFDERTAVQLVLFSGNINKLFRAQKRFFEKEID